MSPERNVNIRHVSRENIHRYPPRLILTEQLGCQSPPPLILESACDEMGHTAVRSCVLELSLSP
jgi:hypothetical protein